MEKPIRPSDKRIETTILSGQNMNEVKIPCFLHPTDVDRLHDCLHEYLKSCEATEKFISELEEEMKTDGSL